MHVNFFPPSEVDAEITRYEGTNRFDVHPRFFNPNGPGALGLLIVRDSKNNVVDRVLLTVNGRGKIAASHRNEEIKPLLEQEKGDKDGGAAQPSAGSRSGASATDAR
jgi:hypothetical protein